MYRAVFRVYRDSRGGRRSVDAEFVAEFVVRSARQSFTSAKLRITLY